MRLLRGLYNCPADTFSSGCVATIGNFDGVHLGHQAIIKRLTAKSAELNLPSAVVLFEPHPAEYFTKNQQAATPARLLKLTDKVTELARLGVDYVLCLRFNQHFSQMSALDFVERLLINSLNIKHLFIGDDFKFGHKRQGDFKLLKACAQNKFTVEANHSVTTELSKQQETRISSSLIRQAIAQADFSKAEQMLGKPFRISGKVAHGDKQGRQIGVPTANIALKRLKSPLQGVYAVRVYGINASRSDNITSDKAVYGVANVGHKPTLRESTERLEVHLFDFEGELYGQKLSIEPIAKIRGEQKFESVEMLIQQIEQDKKDALTIFKQINKVQ